MIRAIIFDCFGVLVVDAFSAMTMPLRTSDPERFARIMDLINASVRGHISPVEYRQQVSELLGMTTEEFLRKESQGETKNDELLAYLAPLRKTYKTAMLSNIGSAGLARRFVPGELEKYFDVVVASGDIGFAKPEPEAYEITAERLNVRTDECVMIDDREECCAGARAVGMQAIHYENLTQLKRELETLLNQSEK